MEFTIVPAQQEPKKRKSEVGEKARAALWIWFFCAVGLWVVAFMLPGPVLSLLHRFILPPGIAALLTAVVGMLLVWTAATQDSRILARQWGLEDDDRERQRAALEAAEHQIRIDDDQDADPETLTDEQKIDLVATQLLARFYIDHLPITRDECVKAGACNQPDWNTVNQLMKARGVKAKNKMRDDLTFETAWALWRAGKKRNQSWAVSNRQFSPKS